MPLNTLELSQKQKKNSHNEDGPSLSGVTTREPAAQIQALDLTALSSNPLR
jgi:hypothetical protein